MAEGKKTILIYADWLPMFDGLDDDEAGRLIKHLLRYVNDLNPEAPDKITKVAFEPIKAQLKRDLVKWEAEVETKSSSGIIGNLKRWHPDLYAQHISGELTLPELLTIAQCRKVSHPDKSNRTPSHPIANIADKDKDKDKDINSLPLLGGFFENSENKPRSEVYFENFKKNVAGTQWWELCQKTYQATEKELLDFAQGWFFEQTTSNKSWKDEADLKSHYQHSFKIHKQKNGNTATKAGFNRTGGGTTKPKGKVDTGASFPGKWDNTHWDM